MTGTPNAEAPRIAWRHIAITAAALLTAGAASAQAPRPEQAQRSEQAPRTDQPPRAATGDARPARADQGQPRRLPADQVTDHTLELPGRTLRFQATAGTIPLYPAEGDQKLLVQIAYVAYTRPDSDPSTRPVTFVFNGGPGSASAYLHLGVLGPWRLPLDGASASTPPRLVANAETWLDFTDLVFIDPAGTGYSRLFATGDDRKRFWSVDADAQSVAATIRKWVERRGRQASAKLIVGESYGGFRALKVTRALAGQGIGVAGMVLVSPVLDFGWRGHTRYAPLGWVARLPSMAATAREIKPSSGKPAPFDREALREVERYAAGEFLADLMRGERDAAAVERLGARVAALTGLDPALVRRLAGRVDSQTFLRELDRAGGRVASAYDATVTSLDPEPTAATSHPADPFTAAIGPPLSSAMTDLYARVLKWRVEAPYQLTGRDVNRSWDWGRGGRSANEAIGDLRAGLAADPRLAVLVAHGASDLVTPYFETQLILDQFPAFAGPERLKLTVYGGGHMFYSRDDSRRAFRTDAERLYRAVSEPPKGG